MYPEPDVFKPERFLNPDGTSRDEPTLISAFGYGKRTCPGRHFEEATLSHPCCLFLTSREQTPRPRRAFQLLFTPGRS
ncbi:hypothetical protein BJV74DRAFT_107147 [Russula compacta]|nr:hypothetical protein BJV74DRAFT_107147 [Russula compacta]